MSELSDQLWAMLLEISGVEERGSTFSGGVGLWANGTEVAYLRAEHALELRLTKKTIAQMKRQLKASPGIEVRGASDWITVRFESEDDFENILELAEHAVRAQR